jgi:hypothetical protein
MSGRVATGLFLAFGVAGPLLLKQRQRRAGHTK